MATEAYAPPELPWANQSGNEGAANTIAQQKAREREAQEKAEAEAEGGGGGEGEGGGGSIGEGVKGTFGLEGECTGSGACAASTTKCSVAFELASVETGVLATAARTKCSKTMSSLNVQVCLYAMHEGERELVAKCPSHPVSHADSAFVGMVYDNCHSGTNYEAWVWGWAKSGRYVYNSHGGYSEPTECSGVDTRGALIEFLLEHSNGE
jgi:hypothetical protein